MLKDKPVGEELNVPDNGPFIYFTFFRFRSSSSKLNPPYDTVVDGSFWTITVTFAVLIHPTPAPVPSTV